MAYRKKKRGRVSKKSIAWKKPSARNQQKQLIALKSQINANSRAISGITYKVMHSTRLALAVTGTTPDPYRVLFLNAISGMNQIFSAPSESAGGKYNWDKRGMTHIRFSIQANTELHIAPISIFIVSCKNTKVANSCGITTSNNLQLTSGVDYITNIPSASVFINKKRFNVHYQKDVDILPVSTLGGTTPWQGQLKSYRYSFSMKNPLRLNNRVGIWSDPVSMPDYAVNPNQRLFMLVFNNNISTPSTFPTLNGMVLHTAYTSE